jgi:hypothetical protein
MKINKPKSFKDIIEQIGEINVFKYYIPNLKINTPVLSIFRNEKNPSFIVYYRDNKVRYKDFGNGNYKGDCIDLVCQLFNLNKHDAIIKIQEDFGLLKSNPDQELKRVISSLPITKDVKQKKAPDIVVSTRSFNSNELDYWNDYYQDISDLKRENIYVPKKIWINKNPIDLKVSELTFCYYYPENDKWKIYFPFKEKSKKWLSNIPLTTSWGLENINKDKNTLICKSKKDYMVCRKIYSYVTGVQNESIAAFSEDFVNELKKNSKLIYYGGDSDAPGKAASYLITQQFGFKHINPVDRLLPETKDWADWAKITNLKTIEDYFKLKNII